MCPIDDIDNMHSDLTQSGEILFCLLRRVFCAVLVCSSCSVQEVAITIYAVQSGIQAFQTSFHFRSTHAARYRQHVMLRSLWIRLQVDVKDHFVCFFFHSHHFLVHLRDISLFSSVFCSAPCIALFSSGVGSNIFFPRPVLYFVWKHAQFSSPSLNLWILNFTTIALVKHER